MPVRSARLLLLAATLSLAGAAFCSWKAHRLTHEAAWAAARSERAADAFSRTLEGPQQDRELAALDERHALLRSASRFQRASLLLLVLSVLGLFAAWVARELRLAREAMALEESPPAAAAGAHAGRTS